MNNLCFVSCISTEWQLGRRLINQIKYLFSEPEIIIIFDGTSNEEFESFCVINEVKIVKSDKLKLQKYGNFFVQRFFQVFLNFSEKPYLIRVEPDTYFFKAFNSVPDAEVAGNILQVTKERNLIQGGCVFFKRNAVKRIVNADLLSNSKYITNSEFSYQRYKPPYLNESELQSDIRLVAEDAVFSDIIWQLGIEVQEWNEVYCRVRQAELMDLPLGNYSAIHPVKSKLLCL